MSNRIQVLTEKVANQIAAGEVIERPASVVKELVENALDAEADRIEIEIQRGGKNLIRVTDNGWGMSYDDALLSLERHATSKIRKAEDLDAIHSYGFRGEAIPSIASVCRFRMLTRERIATAGTEIVIEGGKIVRVNEAGCAVGTMIEARSLFSNLPARRKFLRSDPTEWAHIEQFLRLVALANPKLHLVVHHNNQKVFQYPSVKNLDERLPAVFGKKWTEDVIRVDAEKGLLKLRGVIGKPGISRASRDEQNFFINGRPVHNSILNYALLEGYHTALMKGRYPVAILFMEIDPASVDVNVHPAKREVRFRDGNNVRNFVIEAISGALRSTQPKRDDIPWSLQPPLPPEPIAVASPLNFISPMPVLVEKEVEKKAEKFSFPEVKQPAVEKNHHLRVVGVILNLYIIAEGNQGLVLIDQQAAHTRILFEKMLTQLEKHEVLSQSLLLPVAVELPPEQADFLRRHVKSLQKIGLGVSEMGGNTFMVDALPPMVRTQNVEEFFRTVVANLREMSAQNKRIRRVNEEDIIKIVCQHAVTARESLKAEEIDRLLSDLHACDLPYTSPDGRPTMIMISRSELERKFGKLN